MIFGIAKTNFDKYDYVIFLENLQNKSRFWKGYNSLYLFNKALNKYKYSKKITVLGTISR